MKRIIALVLVLCMTLGMVVSVSAASNTSFTRTLKIIRLIRTLFAKDDEGLGFGVEEDGKLIVYVAPNGKKDAEGTEKSPLTLEAARDAVRDVNKKDYKGIDIVLAAGNYVLDETFALTEEDAGTKNCVIRYIGEEGATIIGGVALTSKDFAPATGDTSKYFPKADKVVQYDLKKLGYTVEDIAADFASRAYTTNAVRLFSNGEMQTIARYPNVGEDEIVIQYGDCTQDYGKEPKDWKDIMTFGVTEEVISRIRSWHTYEGAFLSGYTDYLWRINHTYLTGVSADEPEFYTPFPGTSTPRADLVFYLYNIPEELDAPGEYYIDKNAILYYYPTEDFDTATISVPVVDSIINVDAADYTTFENLTIETSSKNGLDIKASNITIYDCVIRGMVNSAIVIDGYNNTITTNHIYNTGAVGTKMSGGDEATLTSGNNLFTNNYCHEFGILARGYNGALEIGGCGNTASHNEIFGGEHQGIHWSGVRNVIEYNYLHDLCQIADDMGAIYGGGINMVDCTVRYNYIQNIGIPKDHFLRNIEGYPYCGSHGTYWDMYNGNNNTYGNIYENIQGAGVAMGNGRNIYICNNLFISCTYAVTGICGIYHDAYFGTPSSAKNTLKDYMYNEYWKEAYPEMSMLVMDMRNTTADDYYGWAAPVNVTIMDNYSYGDKNNADYRGMMTLSLEAHNGHFMRLNPDTIVDMKAENGNLTVFNSRRGMPEIQEALETAKDVVSITYETFLQMGADWTPAK